ncbi:uncharacterized protein KRP23_11819 [Phytophthora ramorum]|uniref:uncharacterized protein n=1 Tax=Phytophthora ramorum TaxID=164328 RepID=UPI0030B6B292|nr:hypothetical protein KRP23_11819 [Phytophthora ramorum]
MKASLAPHILFAALLAVSSSAANLSGETGTVQPASSGANQEQQQTFTSSSDTDVIQSMSTWGAPIVANTGTNHTSAVPTFGDVTSKIGECVTGNPNEYISNEYLDWVWEHRIGPNVDVSNKANWNVMANKNWIMDKLVHNNGSMNYCVRWDTDNQLSKDVASKFEGVLTRHYNAWNKWLEGYNLAIHGDQGQHGSVDGDGVTQCPDECYRYYDSVNNMWSDTSACKGEPFDVSFWLKGTFPTASATTGARK